MQKYHFPADVPRFEFNYRHFILLFLLPVLIIGGIIFGVIKAMNDGAETYAQADALFYNANGHTVMASVVTHESGSTETYIDNVRYAEAIDVETGKRLWRVELDARNNNDKDFGHAALLGQSAKYLFFLRNELYVIDKQTGKVIARNDHFGAVKDKMSREELTYYNDSRINFAYNDSLQAVLFKGTDGLFYSISGTTLKVETIQLTDPERYFKPRNPPYYTGLITQAYDDGKQGLALLDNKEAQLSLAIDPREGAFRFSSEKSVRRYLVSHPVDRLNDNWKKINETVYIYGGFLTDPQQNYSQPADSLATSETYKLFAGSYNNIHAPIHLSNGGLIVAHKASTENNATVLLTALFPDGKVIWQANTDYRDISLLYKHPTQNKLLLLGMSASKPSYPMQQLLCINLGDGTLQSYPIK